MEKQEMSQKIIEILEAETRCGFEMYACLKSDEGLVCTKFNLEDKKGKSFKDYIREKIANCITECFLEFLNDIAIHELI